MKIEICSGALSLLFALSCSGKEPKIEYIENPAISAGFKVGPSNICLPLRRVLLVRSPTKTYAVRLDQAFVSRDGGSFAAVLSTSMFSGGHWTTKTERVEERQLRGPGHPFMFQTGNTRVTFDTLSLRFNGPGCVSMYPYNGKETDRRLTFAPTAWVSLPTGDLAYNSFHWYSVDLNRSIDIPIESLPSQ
jgi:hypothetical protein